MLVKTHEFQNQTTLQLFVMWIQRLLEKGIYFNRDKVTPQNLSMRASPLFPFCLPATFKNYLGIRHA